MKKSTLSILILSSLLLAEAKADGVYTEDDEPAPLLKEFCEIILGTDSDLTSRCVNSKASSEHIEDCAYYPKYSYYKDARTDEMFVSCLEANKGRPLHCGALASSYLERAECLKIVKDSDISSTTVYACNKWPKGKEMECLKTAKELGLKTEKCDGWPTDKKMECLEILKAQKQ